MSAYKLSLNPSSIVHLGFTFGISNFDEYFLFVQNYFIVGSNANAKRKKS
jgi:hypothetical protein